jgi:hypothetical protein
MFARLMRIWNFLRKAIGLVIPFFAKANDWRGWGRVFRWAVRICVLLVWIVGLYLLNCVPAIRGLIEFRDLEWLEGYFLPVIGLLVVIVGWAALWVWILIVGQKATSDHPDIDKAWDEAIGALNREGIDLKDYPLFLVLGKPQKPEELLFRGADLRFAVRQSPASENAPLHLYAFHDGNHDSIFVTCPRASILGKHASILSGEFDEPDEIPGECENGTVHVNVNETARPDDIAEAIIAIYRNARSQGRNENQLTPEELERVRELERRGRDQTNGGVLQPALLQDDSGLEVARARLRHLCQLIVRDRGRYIPANGIVLLLPWKATGSEEAVQATIHVCRDELAIVAETFRLHCPLWVVVCDMDSERGFAQFVARFPRTQIKDRLGTRFTMHTSLSLEDVREKLKSVGDWLYRCYFPNWIYKFLSLDPGAQGPGSDDIRQNSELVRLLDACHEREKRFGELLKEIIYSKEKKGGFRFGGCYTVALGETLGTDQAFIPGLMRKFTDNKNEKFVSWTLEAAREDAALRRWTRVGYWVIGAIAFLAMVLVVIILLTKRAAPSPGGKVRTDASSLRDVTHRVSPRR